MESDPKTGKINIVYKRPALHRRVLANLIDILLLVLLFFLFFIGVRGIVGNTQTFKDNSNTIQEVRTTSGLYVKQDNNLYDVVTWIDKQSKFNASQKKSYAINTINNFITFSNPTLNPTYGNDNFYKTITKRYDEFFSSEKLVDSSGVKYFVKNESGTIIENPECKASYEDYYKNAYAVFIDSQCQNTLVTCCTQYLEANRYMALMLFAVEIPISYSIAGLLVYVVPPFIFRRGRKTIGKLVYRIGLVDSKCLNVKTKVIIGRICIVYFGEVLLSLVTFAIPVIISFSMMVFTKSKQSFPDYMLNLNEIDLNSNKIFYNYDEIKLEDVDSHKKPVSFTAEKKL